MNMIDFPLKDDGGSLDLLVRAAEKASNGDGDLKLEFLMATVIEDLVNSKYEKATETALLVVRGEDDAVKEEIDGSHFVNVCFKIPKKPRCNKSLKRQFFSQHIQPPLKKQRRTYNLENKKKKYDDGVGLDPPFDFTLKDDGGSFDLLVRAAEKASNGDEDLKLEFLTATVIEDFVNWKNEKAMERALLVVREEEEALKKEIDRSQFVNLCCKIPKKPRSNKSLKLKTQFLSQHTQPPLKKQRRTYNLENKKKKYDDEVGLDVPLPVELRNEIERLKGSDVVMVMQKKLTTTDMDTHQNRLSVPRGKIREEFLREEERNKLDENGGIRVSMIEPCLQLTTNLELKKWVMGKSFSYALIGKWSSISHNWRNHLQPNSIVQLWSFRVDSNLCFALVKC